jgi:hypothetical protein
MSINAPNQAPPADPSAAFYGPGGPAPLPYPVRRRRRGLLGFAVTLGVVAVTAGVGAGAYVAGRSAAPAGPAQAVAAPTSVAPPIAPTLSPEAAQAQTCGVLKANYRAVSDAIDAANKFDKTPWSDPAALSTVNNLVSLGMNFANQLEASLSPSTPPQLKTAVVEYVAALRATSISQRNHASNVQLNGTGLFYNQVVDQPLRICGIPN